MNRHPFPSVRITIRMLMAAIALMAILLAGGLWTQRMIRLRNEYADSATLYANLEFDWFTVAAEERNLGWGSRSTESARLSARYGELRRKYERVARCPWINVELDPDEHESLVIPVGPVNRAEAAGTEVAMPQRPTSS